MEYTKLGRIRPVYKGAWSASTAYTALEIVKSADGRKAYIAVKNVPKGTALTDAAYWAPVLDVSDVLDELQKEVAEATELTSLIDTLVEKTRTHKGKMEVYRLPETFSWRDIPLPIITDGETFEIGIDVSHFRLSGEKTIYVDPENGSNNNDGLTRDTAVAYLESAVKRAASGDTIIFICAPRAIYPRQVWTCESAINKSLNIIAENRVVFYAGNALTYTQNATYPHIWQAPRTNVLRVVDLNYSDEGIEYAVLKTLEECAVLPGSWYTDGTNLYVHTITGEEPNERVLNLLTATGLKAEASAENLKLYLENIDIVGGYSGGNLAVANTESYTEPEVYAKNCRFMYAYGMQTDGKNAVNLTGVKRAIFQNCVCAYSRSDGFNYSSSNGTPVNFIEINCVAHDNGDNTFGDANTNNGSTAHSGSTGLRCNGAYYNNVGANVADVHEGTQSVNLGCKAFNSKATVTDFNANFSAQQAGTTMWLERCTAYGADWDLYAFSGTTMNVKNCVFETTQGGGIINVENDN